MSFCLESPVAPSLAQKPTTSNCKIKLAVNSIQTPLQHPTTPIAAGKPSTRRSQLLANLNCCGLGRVSTLLFEQLNSSWPTPIHLAASLAPQIWNVLESLRLKIKSCCSYLTPKAGAKAQLPSEKEKTACPPCLLCVNEKLVSGEQMRSQMLKVKDPSSQDRA